MVRRKSPTDLLVAALSVTTGRLENEVSAPEGTDRNQRLAGDNTASVQETTQD
jgi:hypothetical protein